jgi:hypothetical protein
MKKKKENKTQLKRNRNAREAKTHAVQTPICQFLHQYETILDG